MRKKTEECCIKTRICAFKMMNSADFGAFMGVVGFFYAVSQFVVAKPVIEWSSSRGEWASLRVLNVCIIGMGIGRLVSYLPRAINLSHNRPQKRW